MKQYDLLCVPNWWSYKEFVVTHHDASLKDGHWHHIVPRCLGGSDDVTNLVRLSVDDHKTAHLLLAECFEYGTDAYLFNMWSAKLLGATTPPSLRTGANNTFYGKHHTDAVKQALAKRNVDLFSGVSYDDRYGPAASVEREKRRKAVKQVHESRSESEKQIIKAKMKKAALSVPVAERQARARKAALAKTSAVKVDGMVFECIKDACKYFNLTKYFLFKQHTVEKVQSNESS